MSCERYATALADYACGADLAPDAAAHLASCPACAARLVQDRRAIQGLDAELQHMLAVEPSPFFVQRVQAHINASPAVRSRRMIWWSCAAAAAAVGILAVGIAVRRPVDNGREPAGVALPSGVTATNQVQSGPRKDVVASARKRPSTGEPVAPSTGSATRTRRTRSAVPTAVTNEPDVQVPADQMRAIARYMALIRSGRLDATTLTARPDAAMEMTVSPLEIEPIVVSDIDLSTSPAVERRQE